MGRGRSVPRIASTEDVAKEAAINSSHPREEVAATLTRIARGAARAAPAVSSDMCAAESSVMRLVSNLLQPERGIQK